MQATPQGENAPTVHGLRRAGKLRPGQEAGAKPSFEEQPGREGAALAAEGAGEPRPGTPLPPVSTLTFSDPGLMRTRPLH